MEDEEALQAGAVVGDAADLVEDLVNELLADSVVTTGVVVGSILLAGDHLLGVEEVLVCAGANLVNDVGLEIAVDGAGNVFAVACTFVSLCSDLFSKGAHTRLGEKGAEAMVGLAGLVLLDQTTIRLFAEHVSHVELLRNWWGGEKLTEMPCSRQ